MRRARRRSRHGTAQHGIIGLAPLDTPEPARRPDEALWQTIFRDNPVMMSASDIVIANLTPFRGASAGAGTLVELGWCLGRGKPCFGYSNSECSRRQIAALPDPVGSVVKCVEIAGGVISG